jgi:hypothetical protein
VDGIEVVGAELRRSRCQPAVVTVAGNGSVEGRTQETRGGWAEG